MAAHCCLLQGREMEVGGPAAAAMAGRGRSEEKPGGAGGEVWYEHKLPDGRVYFSHSQTQKTVWERPQNVQVFPHPAQQSTYVYTHCDCVVYVPSRVRTSIHTVTV